MTPAPSERNLRAALALHQAGRLEDAAACYDEILATGARSFDAVHLAGTAALQRGRLPQAAAMLAEARQLDPRSALCALRLGLALDGTGRPAEAEAALREAVGLDASLPEGWFHLGTVLRRLGRVPEAIGAYERALRLRPAYAEAHERLGSLLAGFRGYPAAEPHLRRVTELQPTRASAWCNLGVSLTFAGGLGEALGCFNRALALDPKFDHAHAGRGLALSKCYRQAAAVEAYGRALALNPDNHEARSARLCELQYLGGLSREALFGEHRAFGRAVEAQEERRLRALPAGGEAAGPGPAGPKGDPAAGDSRRLRVGFLSPDLLRHSVAYFLEPLLAQIDRGRFEIFLYHDRPTVDATSERLQGLADTWETVAGHSADRVEARLRRHALDILIDLAGHTGHNRLPLYARRLAPVQATYLGYPDTTGLAAMDFRLVDAVSDPVGQADAFATERLVRFAPTAWSYAPPPDAPDPASPPAPLTGRVAFGCFNNFAKINDETLRVWSRLLAAVPGSRLVLKGHGLSNAALQGDARRRMAIAGIDSGRVGLLERTRTVRDHLDAYGGVDIALDTFPYNGTTTTCEALWMGVPVIAIAGDRHSARVGASLLTAVGHPEWIASGPDDYVSKAAAAARDCLRGPVGPRRTLREDMRRSDLLDHAAQAERFGAALRQMWEARAEEPAGMGGRRSPC